jgi:hypothetical protein
MAIIELKEMRGKSAGAYSHGGTSNHGSARFANMSAEAKAAGHHF